MGGRLKQLRQQEEDRWVLVREGDTCPEDQMRQLRRLVAD